MDVHPLLSSWQNFYVALCGASAAMVGLLFVGLSLHLRVVVQQREVRALAQQTFTNFVGISLIALVMLMPAHSLEWQGLGIVVWATSNFLAAALRLWRSLRATPRLIPILTLLSRFGGTATAHLGLAVVGTRLAEGATMPYWLVVVLLWLLLACVRNAWDLLVSVGEMSYARQAAAQKKEAA